MAALHKLNVGCGNNIMEGFVNIDSADLPGVDINCNLEYARIDLPDESVELFFLSHILEHIHNTLGLMEELYRLAIPDAAMIIKVPYGSSDEAWEDQTHVRAYFPGSFRYFSQPLYWRADYGYWADWQPKFVQLMLDKERFDGIEIDEAYKIVRLESNAVKEMLCDMIAVKPARARDKNLIENTRVGLRLV